MPATRNPNAVDVGSGKQAVATVPSSALTHTPGYYPTSITMAYNGGPAWHDGTTNPANNVEGQLDKIVSDLVNSAGADRVGSATYSYLPSGSIQDALRGIVDSLDANLVATPGAELIGVGGIGGFGDREIDGAAANEDPGGIGTTSDFGGPAYLQDALTIIDLQLRRRRAFTGTVVHTGSTIRSGDYEQDDISNLATRLNTQIASQQGGHFFIHTRDTAGAYEIDDMVAGQYPRMVSESMYGGTTFPVDETSFLGGVPIESTTANSDLAGIWEGFQFNDDCTFLPGYHGEHNVYMNDLVLTGGFPTARPASFHNCVFSRNASNTVGNVISLTDSGTGGQAVFSKCVFGGGSGTHTTLLSIALEASTTFTLEGEGVVFRDCIFDATGCNRAIYTTSSNQRITFENCRFIGDPTSTDWLVNIFDYGFKFINCQFSGCPHLYTGFGSVEGCTFYVDMDRTDLGKEVIDLDFVSDNEDCYWRDNTLTLDGAFATAVTTTPVVIMNTTGRAIDGLHIRYADGITNLAQVTLDLQFDPFVDDSKCRDAKNIHIDLNHKMVKGTTPTYPQIVDIFAVGGTQVNNHVIDGLTIKGVDMGNPDGDGAGGVVLSVAAGVAIVNSTIMGAMDDTVVTEDHLWSSIVSISRYTRLNNFSLVCENSSDLTPRGAVAGTFNMGDLSSVTNSFIHMGRGDSTVLGSIGNDGALFYCGSGSRDFVEILSNTVYYDPVEAPLVYGIFADATSVKHNRFLSVLDVARNYQVIDLPGNDHYAAVESNMIQHRADAGGSPQAIDVDGDRSRVADNTILRLAGDGGFGTLITHAGTGIVTRDNLVQP